MTRVSLSTQDREIASLMFAMAREEVRGAWNEDDLVRQIEDLLELSRADIRKSLSNLESVKLIRIELGPRFARHIDDPEESRVEKLVYIQSGLTEFIVPTIEPAEVKSPSTSNFRPKTTIPKTRFKLGTKPSFLRTRRN